MLRSFAPLRRLCWGVVGLMLATPPIPARGGADPACTPEAGPCFVANFTPGCEVEECCNTVCAQDSFCCLVEWDVSCATIAIDSCDIGLLCPGEGDCYAGHGSAGCADEDCCADVCAEMPDCCLLEWTQACADLALEECPCGAPQAGSCFEAHDGPGCLDVPCCSTVCGIDSFCCFEAWDSICALEAAYCGAVPCELTCPAGAVTEPEYCLALTNEGCNGGLSGGEDPPPLFTPITCGDTVCGSAFARFTRDTDWYAITLTETTELTWTVTAEFPAAFMIVEGTCQTSIAAVAEAFTSDCGTAQAVHCLGPGTYYLFISTAIPQRTLRAGAPCPMCAADFNDDGLINAIDLAALLGAWGEQPEDHFADLNDDGLVNPADLAALLGSWGVCPQPASALWGNDYIATVSCGPCR